MTVETTNVFSGPLATNGSTTAFPFTFKAITADEVAVTLTDADGQDVTPGAYTVTLDDDAGGTVTFTAAPPTDLDLVIYSDPSFEQTTSFSNQAPFLPDVLNNLFDRAAIRSQVNRDRMDRALVLPFGEDGFTLPGVAARADKFLGFDGSGQFTVLDGTGGGGGGGDGAPGGNVMSIGLFTEASGLEVDAGTDIVQTSGYSAAGKGHALYIYDAAVNSGYVSSYPRAAFIAEDGRGFRLSGEQQLNVMMFGAVADDSTDNLTAFNAARDYSKKLSLTTSGDFRAGAPLYIPNGRYYISGTWNIHHSVWIRGSGAGQPGAIGPILRFANNVNGIVFHDYRTTDADGGGAGSAGLGDAGGSILEGVSIWGGNAATVLSGPYAQGDSPTGHGIRIRCISITIRDVFVAFFGEDGININATSGASGSTQGNANSFRLDNVWCTYMGRYGVLINGSDVNAGATYMLSTVSCAGGGLMDYSFLGNTHIQPHTRDNCVFDHTGNAKPTSTCVYSGLYYYVVAGQHVAASTTTPGTDSSVWRTFVGHPSCKTWTSGLTWVTGSPYGTNPSNTNARNVFVGAYGEAAQPPAQATYPTLFVGGLLDEVGVVGSATWMRGNSQGGVTAGAFTADGTNRDIQFGSSDGDQLIYFPRGSTDFRWRIVSGERLIGEAANSTIFEQLGLDNDTSGHGPLHRYFRRLIVGHSSGNGDGVLIGSTQSLAGLATDLNGQAVKAGWVWHYQNPTKGGRRGAVCITAGTVGSSAVFAEFGDIPLTGTATYDPGSLAAGAKTSIQTMTVTGAALGDLVQASFSISLAGARLAAWVSSSNTVSYYFVNENGTDPLDLASGTVSVRVVRP